MKRKITIFSILVIMLGVLLFPNTSITVYADFMTDASYKSAVLIERNSGKVLFDDNMRKRVPIASVTKLMTILLTLEKITSGEINVDDMVSVSTNASGMGGSQIFLDANCDYQLSELLKSVIVASANDSSVALAEYIAGSENNFVREMNERARELGLSDTNYSNCTGLPTTDAYSCAYDQSIVLNEVLDYDLYHEYSSIWLENFTHPSGRTTQMTNTNKLSRFYDGCIGGKTGSTNQAKYCLAVGARRADMNLISVVLGAEDSKSRFKLASDLLNYGFDNFTSKTIFSNADLIGKSVAVKGHNRQTGLTAEHEYSVVTNKGEDVNYSLNYNLPTSLKSVNAGDAVGNVEVILDGVVVDTINILATDTLNELTIWDNIKEIISN